MHAARLDQPSDTRIMNLVHAALRRDLDRALVLLGDSAVVPAPRLTALARHLTWLVEFVHTHHTIEDRHLFPTVAAKDPSVRDLAARMDEQHHRIGPALTQLGDLAREVSAGRRDVAASGLALRDAVARLVDVLTPHLFDEEQLLLPVIERLLTEREWQAYDRENLRRGPLDLAFVGHWLLDGLDGERDRHAVTRQVPAVLAWVVIHLMGGPYRRHHRATWSGTPAAAIGSAPLPWLPRQHASAPVAPSCFRTPS